MLSPTNKVKNTQNSSKIKQIYLLKYFYRLFHDKIKTFVFLKQTRKTKRLEGLWPEKTYYEVGIMFLLIIGLNKANI